MPESQFDFDDQDLALAGNIDGIGNLTTSQYQKPKCKIGQ